MKGIKPKVAALGLFLVLTSTASPWIDGRWFHGLGYGSGLALSPDAKLLVARGLWTLPSGRPALLGDPEGRYEAAHLKARQTSFSPDGRRLFARDYNTLFEYDAASMHLLGGLSGAILGACYSADGESIFAISDRSLSVYGKGLKFQRSMQLSDGQLGSIAASPEGSQVAVSSNAGVLILASPSLKVIKTLPGVSAYATLVYSSDGKWLLCADVNGKLWRWDASPFGSDGLQLVYQFGQASNYVLPTLALSPSGEYIAYANNNTPVTVLTFDGTFQASRWLQNPLSSDLPSLCFPSDDALLCLDGKKLYTLAPLDLNDLPDPNGYPKLLDRPQNVSWHPNGAELLVSGVSNAMTVSAHSGKPLKMLPWVSGLPGVARYARSKALIAAGQSEVWIFDPSTESKTVVGPARSGYVKDLRFSGTDGSLAVGRSSGDVDVISTSAATFGALLWSRNAANGQVAQVDISYDGNLIAYTDTGKSTWPTYTPPQGYVFRLSDGALLKQWDAGAISLRFSPNGKFLLHALPDKVEVFNAATWKTSLTWNAGSYYDNVIGAEFSSDGQWLVLNHGYQIQFVPLATGMSPVEVECLNSTAPIALSPSGDAIAGITTAGSDYEVSGLSVLPNPLSCRLKSAWVDLLVGANGQMGNASVELSAPAPAGGATVAIFHGSPWIKAPSSILVPAGESRATFKLDFLATAFPSDSVLTVTFRGSRVELPLITYPPRLSGIASSVGSLRSRGATTVTVFLDAPAGPGGSVIELSTDSTHLSIPVQVTVGAGKTSAQARAVASLPAVSTVATITASQRIPLSGGDSMVHRKSVRVLVKP